MNNNVISIIWIIVGFIVFVFIYEYNKKMQVITNKMIDEIDRSNSYCDAIVGDIKKANTKEEIEIYISKLEDEALKFQNYYKDQNNWPKQSSRILRQISNIRKYITFAKEIKQNKK